MSAEPQQGLERVGRILAGPRRKGTDPGGETPAWRRAAATTQEPRAPEPTAASGRVPAEAELAPAPETAAKSGPAFETEAATASVNAPEAASVPAKSDEEVEEEQFWAEGEVAWERDDFAQVSAWLGVVTAGVRGDAAGAARSLYRWGVEQERLGERERALFLYREARQRDPSLREAAVAAARLEAQLASAPPPYSTAQAEAPTTPPETDAGS